VFVDVRQVEAHAWSDTLVCLNERLVLHADGGTTYQWSPQPSSTDSLVLDPAVAGTFSVLVMDDLGCQGSATVTVSLFPPAFVMAGHQASIDFGESAPLFASGTGSFIWQPDSSLSCSTCP